jgi:glycerol kinase
MLADVGRESFALLLVDGGASQNGLLMQLQADALQLPVRRPAHLETTSLGAAYAAGIGSGFWTREWVLEADMQQGDTVEFLPQVWPAW